MTTLDTRLQALDSHAVQGPVFLRGMRVIPVLIALTSSTLAVALEPGEAVINNKVQQFAGRASLSAFAGTLTDLFEVYATTVTYYNPLTDTMIVAVLEGVEQTVASGDAAPLTDDEIESALPTAVTADPGSHHYTVNGVTQFARSGSAITATFDHVPRSYGVPTEGKATSGGEQAIGGPGALYVPHSKIVHSIDSEDWANADILTDLPLPGIAGRIVAMRGVVEKTIVGASALVLVDGEINAAAITGGQVSVAESDAEGTVIDGAAITADNTFVPGDTFTLVGSGSTAGTAGRVRIEADIEALAQ